MRFQNVHLERAAHVLPDEVVTSLELEERLAPVYDALRLRPGRIELMSGITERRFWEKGTRPSEAAARAGARALAEADFDRTRIGCLISASVCRDFMEPATAAFVHRALELPPSCAAFDLSNACLGAVNAMGVVAGMIERREIEAGLVVAGETGRPLVEETVASLLNAPTPTRGDVKRAFASLTIGSGAAAVLLVHADLARSSDKLLGGVTRAATHHNELCRGDVAPGRGRPLMETDSEALLNAGRELAGETWSAFLEELAWSPGDVDRIVTHQVGVAHRRAVLGALGLDPALDFPTVERLGNIGSVSLPLSFSMARNEGFIADGDRVAMLGIGSGLFCQMLAVSC